MSTTTPHTEFISTIAQLAALLHHYERSSTLSILLKELRKAVHARLDGALYDQAEGFAWARAEWRVREGLVDRGRELEALRLLNAAIVLGLSVFREIGWDLAANAALAARIQAATSVEVWLS